MDFLSRLDDHVYLIAEAGGNHLGEVESARRMVLKAAEAGCDAIKFQTRTPNIAVPEEWQSRNYATPWGTIPYLDYRIRMEFNAMEYATIATYARQAGIDWFTSVWDIPSVDFMEQFDPICYKIPSACLTDHDLLRHVNATGRPVILSTGMSTKQEIQEAVDNLPWDRLLIAHCTSTYPCSPEELNLDMITTLEDEFPSAKIGFSSHEEGYSATLAAVALGAQFVERHFTLDKEMWGSDQAMSLDPPEMKEMVERVRYVEKACGDGTKRVYDSEKPMMEKLRRVYAAQPVA